MSMENGPPAPGIEMAWLPGRWESSTCFTGSTVLHWAQGMNGKGALLSGDTLQVVSDRRYVSFMYSYPNLIPLAAENVHHVVEAVKPYRFERVYSAWWDREIRAGAKTIVADSAKRYAEFVSGSAFRSLSRRHI